MCKWERSRKIEELTKITKVLPLNTIFNKDKTRCWVWRESVLSSDQEKHNKEGWSCYKDSSLLFPLIKGVFLILYFLVWDSLIAQLVKNLPAMGETWDQSLGWEDPLEKGKATHSSILAWRIPWTLISMGCKMLEMTEWLSLSYLV